MSKSLEVKILRTESLAAANEAGPGYARLDHDYANGVVGARLDVTQWLWKRRRAERPCMNASLYLGEVVLNHLVDDFMD
jgi:hypothetical protein